MEVLMIITNRLILRQWKDGDIEKFIKINKNSRVMKYYPSILTTSETIEFITNESRHLRENGWGYWAVELKSSGSFLGFIGLKEEKTLFDFSPCIAIAWRIDEDSWGNGYATEGAAIVLKYAFENLNLNEVVAFTASSNIRSEEVMKHLKMTKIKEFVHPLIDKKDPLSKHILYSIKKHI